MIRRLVRFLRSERGQGLAEYALILSSIALAAVLALTFFGAQLAALLGTIGTSVAGVKP